MVREHLSEVVIVLGGRKWLEGGEQRESATMELFNAASYFIPVSSTWNTYMYVHIHVKLPNGLNDGNTIAISSSCACAQCSIWIHSHSPINAEHSSSIPLHVWFICCMHMCVVQAAAKLISCARHSTATVNEPVQEVLLSNITKYTIRRLACLRSTITKVQSVHVHVYTSVTF